MYTEHQEFLLECAKDQISFWIEKLEEEGMRDVNIEIELMSLIKEKLKKH